MRETRVEMSSFLHGETSKTIDCHVVKSPLPKFGYVISEMLNTKKYALWWLSATQLQQHERKPFTDFFGFLTAKCIFAKLKMKRKS